MIKYQYQQGGNGMNDAYPSAIRYQLGDAEFTLLKPDTSDTDHEQASQGSLHCHQYFEVHCNTGPSRTLALPSGKIFLESEQFLLICPGCMHYSTPDLSTTSVLSFELHQIKGEAGFHRHFWDLLNGLNLQPLKLSRKFKNALVDFSVSGAENTVMGFCRTKLLGLAALTAMLENMALFSKKADPAYHPEHTGAFDAALDMMLYSELTLDQIAQQLGYSPRHTARLIQRRYGNSLGRIRRNAKKEKEGYL